MKNKIIGIIVLVLIVLGGGSFFLLQNNAPAPEENNTPIPQISHKDISYLIEGETIKLTDGLSEIEDAPGSASKIVTRYFGNEASGDLNGDGRQDVAFLLTQNTGGTGTFYYLVAALKTETGYDGTNAMFLGDRIAPQTTEFSNGGIIVNYADRRGDEPMTATPSIGISKYFKMVKGELAEVALNFEGEADPSRMTLGMKTWVWISALYNDGREIKPKQTGKFTLTFGDDGRFSATTDCNSMSGIYSVRQSAIVFENIASTKMYCEGSEESEFSKLLQNTTSYLFTSRGELILELKFDSGTVTFR